MTVEVENIQIAFTDHFPWGQSSQGYPKSSQHLRRYFVLSLLYLRPLAQAYRGKLVGQVYLSDRKSAEIKGASQRKWGDREVTAK